MDNPTIRLKEEIEYGTMRRNTLCSMYSILTHRPETLHPETMSILQNAYLESERKLEAMLQSRD